MTAPSSRNSRYTRSFHGSPSASRVPPKSNNTAARSLAIKEESAPSKFGGAQLPLYGDLTPTVPPFVQAQTAEKASELPRQWSAPTVQHVAPGPVVVAARLGAPREVRGSDHDLVGGTISRWRVGFAPAHVENVPARVGIGLATGAICAPDISGVRKEIRQRCATHVTAPPGLYDAEPDQEVSLSTGQTCRHVTGSPTRSPAPEKRATGSSPGRALGSPVRQQAR